MSEHDVLLEINRLLERFFGYDKNKVSAWMQASNPLLGNISPIRMVALGRADKLLKMMEAQLDDNRK